VSETRLTRREFLSRGAGAVVAAGAAATAGILLYDPKGDAGLPKPSADAIRLKNYFADIDFSVSSPRICVATGSEERIEQMVRAAVNGLDTPLGMKRFVRPGDVVLIKPNVGFDRSPHLGATTHPEVVRFVIRLCKEAGASRVIVADNPIESPAACFAKSQIGPVAEAEGAKVMLPAEANFKNVAIRDHPPDRDAGEVLGRWPTFHRPLAAATKVIGVAPVKDHNLCSASMGMKNWYGLLGGVRNQFHQDIHGIISDLAIMMTPTLTILDGTKILMKNGPTGGDPSDVKDGDVVMAALDPVAQDAWAFEHLLGRGRDYPRYLAKSEEKGAGLVDWAGRVRETT
jgi:uncharacterized protein (DUF362 family)